MIVLCKLKLIEKIEQTNKHEWFGLNMKDMQIVNNQNGIIFVKQLKLYKYL